MRCSGGRCDPSCSSTWRPPPLQTSAPRAAARSSSIRPGPATSCSAGASSPGASRTPSPRAPRCKGSGCGTLAPGGRALCLWWWGGGGALLHAIRERFEEEWARQRAENARVLGKPVVDLVVCGAGIARFDLPALYCRSLLHEVASAVELFELYFKARPIDLANEAGFLFPEEPHLYPKTTRELAGRLGLRERKGSSKSVWDSYERGEHEAIERRTADELRLVVELYRRLRERVVLAPRP